MSIKTHWRPERAASFAVILEGKVRTLPIIGPLLALIADTNVCGAWSDEETSRDGEIGVSEE